MMAKIAEAKVVTTDVFEKGSIQWKHFNIDTNSPSSPPKPLLIFTPTVPGAYTVIVFYHGFCIPPSYYCDLLSHIVSHGFIVVAPQLVAGKVVDWLVKGLQPLLPENVEAKLEKVVLSGHSKGGQTAFSVALGYVKTMLKFSALIGIDPVGGLSQCKASKTSPKILTGVPRSLNLKVPVAVIGTGLGPEKANVLFPPCAPKGENHVDYFNECKPPCANFVAADYGHMDMLDDETPGIIGTVLSKCLCKNGKGPKKCMRKTVGGLVVAFLRAQLDEHFQDFEAILHNPGLAPARLNDVKYIPA
ncbi:Chlorophyllase-1 protein [Vigna angularis]|uniref:Chlorophyllase-1 protein n=1 Tax=Phaseolus angularis TaxID=3914 RepID=A0A8T0JX51_PHAAN|nr:Chlorophyllase-1 protein [Vigna angularis]